MRRLHASMSDFFASQRLVKVRGAFAAWAMLYGGLSASCVLGLVGCESLVYQTKYQTVWCASQVGCLLDEVLGVGSELRSSIECGLFFLVTSEFV